MTQLFTSGVILFTTHTCSLSRSDKELLKYIYLYEFINT